MTNTTDHAELLAKAEAQVFHLTDRSMREQLIYDLADALAQSERELAGQAATIEAACVSDEELLNVFYMAVGDRAIETGATALPMGEMLRVGLRAVAAINHATLKAGTP